MKSLRKVLSVVLLFGVLMVGLFACKPTETYDVQIGNIENGSVTASATTVEKGASVTLNVSPDEYYELEYLKVNDSEVEVTNNEAVIENVTEDLVVSASFIGVEVTVSFRAYTETADIKVRYGAKYGTLPEANVQPGYEFAGWYTEQDGNGVKVTADTIVSNGNNHTLHAHQTLKTLEVNVTGMVNKLVHLPGSDAETATLSVSILDDGKDITSDVQYEIESSDSSLVVVDDQTLRMVQGASGTAVIRVKVNGLVYKEYLIDVVDYVGLGYIGVSTKEEFLAMNGDNKYLLLNDIDLEDAWLANTETWNPLILELGTNGVIDGNGHVVKNARMASGWNKGWIGKLYGTVKNIVFLNITGPDNFPYGTGLIGTGEGGTIENVYLQIKLIKDGDPTDLYTKGGTLVGTLNKITVKDCVVDVLVKDGLSIYNHGAIAGLASSWDASLTNVYAIVHHAGIDACAGEVAEGVWAYNVKENSVATFDSVHAFIAAMNEMNLFDGNWVFDEDGVTVFGNKVLTTEEALTASIQDNMSFGFSEESCYIDFAVYRYGELSTDYSATYTSSNEEVFTTTVDGAIIFTGLGTATLTIVVEEQITLTCEITIEDDSEPVDEYTYISTAEEWRTLISANPSGKFKLTADIDLAGGWVSPNGESKLCDTFSGELDGQGYVVKNGWMPSGWLQSSAFGVNTGTIKNIGFVNIHGGNLCTDTALVQENSGLIENVFVDWIIETNGEEYGFAGVIAGYSGSGTIKNSIVVLSLGEGLTTAPSFYGSIVGNANMWVSKLENCYAIANGTGVLDIAAKEAAEGVKDYIKSEGNTRQFETYTALKADADLSGYDANIWAFTETTISFGGVVVYEEHVHEFGTDWVYDETHHWHECACGSFDEKVAHSGGEATETEQAVCEVCGQPYGKLKEPVDEYTHITTVEEWLTLIPANPAGKFKLDADLDFENGFITGKDAAYLATEFTGELDGQGYKILNAKLPGGWAGHGMFSYNKGTIKNIAFINLLGSKVTTNVGIVATNKGIIENLYVDYVVQTGTHGDYNGTIASIADNGSEIRNCIVNVRFADGATLPPNQGSIVGKAGGWTGYVKNSYAIINDTGITGVYFNEAASGVAASTCSTSAQFETYQLLKAGADLSGYETNVWTFTDTTISFFGNVVYEVELEPVDEYTHITTVEEWLTLIPANPAGKFKLDADLDFENGFITGKDAAYLATEFTGELDGQGYKILNAKLPGGWAGHGMFSYNKGTIKNIAFINLLGSKVTTNVGIVATNKGIIENLYVDYVVQTGTHGDYNGTIASIADNGSEIRNCIVNVRFADGATLPPNQGSIIGKAGGWTGYVRNCYAIVNGTGITGINFNEAASGVAASTCTTSAQFETYADLKVGADVSMYDTNVWTFTDTTISFFGNVVYTA